MQAIMTTFKGPTNHRGARIIARCQAKRITVPWDHALDVEGNHRAAARILAKQLGWPTRGMQSGGLPASSSYAHTRWR